ncbi:condensin complex subunit 3 [Kwoniella mangroviensis CBS 10435]|uniref:Condensin complex subunit 3 n=1 Tax=Kwoniella mangroviensis CBS 10435 TaxID=1331196 RepID=A0A1B9IGV4_9TREE|nr:condensin complex subunit 3 [Kwoniella mangroviensis CBS 10435]
MVSVITSAKKNRPRALTSSFLTETLPTLLPPIFEQVQHTTANHRKNIVSLHKIQSQCSTITEDTSKGIKLIKGIKLVGERTFNNAFIEMVNRVLPIKKGTAVADRVVKFVASYVAYSTEQDAASKAENQGEEDEEEGVETFSTRFIVKLLKHLLRGMEAKDKNVRFRVTLLAVSMINGLGEMDEDLYVLLRESLLNRARDKEAAVRVQAALGLAKLQSGEDEDDLEEGQESLGEVLLDLLRYDPAAEVRRAALYNLPRNPTTLPHILARTRDIDPILRRTVYAGSLSATSLPDPRVLSIAQREEIVRNGLGDREGNVRKAAAGMLGGWVDLVEGDMIEFLSRFDVVSSQVAEDALISVFVTRPEILDIVEFNDEFWTSLTPEKAFLARVFVDHCISNKDDVRLEEALPVVTALAFCIQDEYNKLVASTNEGDEDVTDRAFIVGELLKLAVNLDYADEIGRRKMFQLAREMISQVNLPEPLIPKCLDVLSKIANGERDLIRVVVDVVTELRAGGEDLNEEGEEEGPSDSQMSSTSDHSNIRRKSTFSASQRLNSEDPEERMKAGLIDLRCLLICISLLERVNTNLQDNSVFHGLLPDLIIPAVRNKEEPALRDQGLICLGLCCMIDAKMAANSFGLFIQQLTAADDDLKVKVCQVVFDLLMLHDINDLVSNTMAADKVVELVRHVLSQDSPEVQAVACEGVAKLMLAGMISDETVLQSLVLLYFSPETADNQPLRQCLTYFLPIYCYSSSENQRRMLSIFSDTFGLLAQLSEEAEDEEMPPISQMGLMMVDWLDPQKTVERGGVKIDTAIHLDLAEQILESLLTETSKEMRKALLSFLSKLNLPESDDDTVESWRLKSQLAFIHAIRAKRPFGDALSKNALVRYEGVLLKRYPELEEYSEDGFRNEASENEKIEEIWGFIDDVEEKDVDTLSEVGSQRGRRASSIASTRRGRDSVTPSVVSDLDEDEDEIPRKSKAKPKLKNQTMEVVEEESEEDIEVEGILDEEEDEDDELAV